VTTRRLVLIILALAVTAPAVALGSRVKLHTVTPTKAERSAILKAWNNGHRLSKAHAACLRVGLAASDHAYGTVHFRLTKTCEHYAFNGVNILRRASDDHWKIVFEGSAYHCPLPRIPRRVQRDLGVCP